MVACVRRAAVIGTRTDYLIAVALTICTGRRGVFRGGQTQVLHH